MHDASMREMTRILDGWNQGAANVLDVGSLNVNGSYREMVTRRGWTYTGLDIVAGPNVDILCADPYNFPFGDGQFDIVISGSAMEHVEAFWLWMPELVRLVRPGGLLAVITHIHWQLNHHRPDCWRILPDGMRFLLDYCGGLERYDIRVTNDGNDITTSAWRLT